MAFDYALSEKLLKDAYNNPTTGTARTMEGDMKNMRISKDFNTCLPDFVPIMKEHLDSQYGGVENYFSTIGVPCDQVESIKHKLLV